MKLFVIICCIAVASSASISDDFRNFKAKFNKAYKNEAENDYRMKVFADNLEKINRHNEEAAAGKHTFTLGVNQFADLTIHEWRETLTFKGFQDQNQFGRPKSSMKEKLVDIPDSIDWRDEGYVTPVKDQGACGSCWAFSTTGSMEGAIKKATGELVSLSEQNLVDCDDMDEGCNGGFMENAFPWIISNGGINTEEDYPYRSNPNPIECAFDANKPTYTIKEFHEILKNDESDLTERIATEGPISVGIDAGQFSFQFYQEGVYYDPNCGTTDAELNHAVLAVGYGVEIKIDYDQPFYWVKNSWGTNWGDNGYIKMARNRDNACGIATDACYPVA